MKQANEILAALDRIQAKWKQASRYSMYEKAAQSIRNLQRKPDESARPDYSNLTEAFKKTYRW